LHALPGHASIVRSVAFSPDGKWIVSGAEDKFVKIWNADTGAEVSSFLRSRSLRWVVVGILIFA
jgi:WD40 repeat protein